MASVNKQRVGDDDTYEATEVIEAGQLVIPASGATHAGVQGIAVAGASATNVLGVASQRAEPVADQNLTGTDDDGYPYVNYNPVDELVTVYKHCVTTVTYNAAAVAYGVKLVAGASGAVKAYTAGTDDAESIIGECRVVGGMGASGGAGLALIY